MKWVNIEARVKLFLVQLEENFNNNKCTISQKREDKKLRDLLYEFGWTPNILFDYLLNNLEPEDYVSGPEEEHNNPDGSLWVFGKVINSVEVYIKITNRPNNSMCISFHEKEYDIYYPLKGGKKK